MVVLCANVEQVGASAASRRPPVCLQRGGCRSFRYHFDHAWAIISRTRPARVVARSPGSPASWYVWLRRRLVALICRPSVSRVKRSVNVSRKHKGDYLTACPHESPFIMALHYVTSYERGQMNLSITAGDMDGGGIHSPCSYMFLARATKSNELQAIKVANHTFMRFALPVIHHYTRTPVYRRVNSTVAQPFTRVHCIPLLCWVCPLPLSPRSKLHSHRAITRVLWSNCFVAERLTRGMMTPSDASARSANPVTPLTTPVFFPAVCKHIPIVGIPLAADISVVGGRAWRVLLHHVGTDSSHGYRIVAEPEQRKAFEPDAGALRRCMRAGR